MSVSFDKSTKQIKTSNDLLFNTSNINLQKEPSRFYSNNDNNLGSSKVYEELMASDDEDSIGGNSSNGGGGGDTHLDNLSTTGFNNDDHNSYQENVMSFEEIQTQKAYYLGEMERLVKNGVKPLTHLDMSNELSEISGEYHRMKHYYDTEIGIRRMRSMLMYSVNLLETFDNNYNLIGDLDGFSMHTQANINEYDDVFSELYNKYKDKVTVGPELRFLIAFGGSLAHFKGQKKIANYMQEEQQRALQEKLNNFKNQKNSNPPIISNNYPSSNPMKGPSMTSDERLRQLGIDEDFSDVSSIKSGISSIDLQDDQITFIDKQEEPAKKKRGRKKKST